ncbi:MAG: DUF5316 family protein [Sporolactobacillus sp.]
MKRKAKLLTNGGWLLMKKTFLIGLIVAALLFLLGWLTSAHFVFAAGAAGIGILCLLMAGVTTGAFISGDRNRANFWSEDGESRTQRHGIGLASFLFGLPCLLSGIVLFLLFD